MEEHSNRQRTPFLFTGKELDEETGLYYFGARYYDPRTSVWQSPDPILARYLASESPSEGIYQPANLNLYNYSFQRPINYFDPDGNAPKLGKLLGRQGDDLYDAALGVTVPRNVKLSNGVHPVTNIPFDANGYPDFASILYRGLDSSGVPVRGDVNIGSLTGRRSTDEVLANARAGLDRTPDGYTWHHHQDKGRMQLVESGKHNATG